VGNHPPNDEATRRKATESSTRAAENGLPGLSIVKPLLKVVKGKKTRGVKRGAWGGRCTEKVN
jgi:hypothetical protein